MDSMIQSDKFKFEEFKQLVAEELGVEESSLTGETTFLHDLGIDSLSLINFVIVIEKRFGIKVELDTVYRLKSVRDAYDIFIEKINAAVQLYCK